MPAYTLTDLQAELFTDLVDLYKPVDRSEDANGWDEGLEYPPTPTYEDVPCLIGPSNELLVPIANLGQSNYDVSDTLDSIFLHVQQECGATWLVYFKTPDHPEYGTWLSIVGDAKAYLKPAEVAHRHHHMKRATKGPGIT